MYIAMLIMTLALIIEEEIRSSIREKRIDVHKAIAELHGLEWEEGDLYEL